MPRKGLGVRVPCPPLLFPEEKKFLGLGRADQDASNAPSVQQWASSTTAPDVLSRLGNGKYDFAVYSIASSSDGTK
ncbi:MAG: hypothetical protein OSA43_09865 [Pirellulales bacterium]|nr:hypothetical protein [Pirellulales bacterium]